MPNLADSLASVIPIDPFGKIWSLFQKHRIFFPFKSMSHNIKLNKSAVFIRVDTLPTARTSGFLSAQQMTLIAGALTWISRPGCNFCLPLYDSPSLP